ncbi:MAG: phosphoglycerate kinase, partial [Candidatus Omnitrophica bacterium]|nr:phosphoglycerate kinase [Candidatus Omnitrophota bacterium]
NYLIDLAEKSKLDPATYKNLIGFARYVAIYDTIDIFKLYSEVDLLEKTLRDKLYVSDDERSLYDLQQKARVLKDLFNVNLTNDGAEYLLSHKNEFKAVDMAAYIRKSCQKYGITIEGGYDLPYIIGRLDEAIKFYNIVHRRNDAIIKNTIKNMNAEKQSVAALITGGFHSRGLADLVKTKGLSYLIIMPKFKQGEDRPYIAVLTNKRDQYEGLIKSGQYELAVHQFFSIENNFDRAATMAIALSGIYNRESKKGPKAANEAMISTVWKWAEEYHKAYNLPQYREDNLAAKRPGPGDFKAIAFALAAAISDGKLVDTDYEVLKDSPVIVSIVNDVLVSPVQARKEEASAVAQTPVQDEALRRINIPRPILPKYGRPDLARKVPMAINGARGRIGRLIDIVINNYYSDDFKLVAINGIPTDLKSLKAFADGLVNPDTTYGTIAALPHDTKVSYGIDAEKGQAYLMVNGNKILVFNERKGMIPWNKVMDYPEIVAGLDMDGYTSFDASNVGYTTKDATDRSIKGGVKVVVFTAPPKDSSFQGAPNVNYDTRKNANGIVVMPNVWSLMSCTTNATVQPVVALNDSFGIVTTFQRTDHAVTGENAGVDTPGKSAKDSTRDASIFAGLGITSSGVGKNLSQLAPIPATGSGANAIRAGLLTTSAVTITAEVVKPIKGNTEAEMIEEVNKVLIEYAKNNPRWMGYGYGITSKDIYAMPVPSVVDLSRTKVIKTEDGRFFIMVTAWYDNEWGTTVTYVENVREFHRLRQAGELEIKPEKVSSSGKADRVEITPEVVGEELKLLPRAVAKKYIRSTDGEPLKVALNGVSENFPLAISLIRHLMTSGSSDFVIAGINSIKDLDTLKSFARLIKDSSGYGRLPGVSFQAQEDKDKQLWLVINYKKSILKIKVYRTPQKFEAPDANIIIELGKNQDNLASLSDKQIRIKASNLMRQGEKPYFAGLSTLDKDVNEFTVSSSLAQTYALTLKAFEAAGVKLSAGFISPVTGIHEATPELLDTGSRDSVSNFKPLDQRELDGILNELKVLGIDVPLAADGNQTPHLAGAYAGLYLFTSSIVPADPLADTNVQAAYINYVLREALVKSGLAYSRSDEAVAIQVMGRTKPLFSLGSTQVVGQKEIALYPLVDENYYEASRLLDLAAEASISNGIRSKNPKAPATPTLKAPAPIVVKEKLNIKDIPDAYWKGKRVVLRADLNVPLKPFDDSRIQAEIPNIKYLLERGARVILSSHLGKTGEGKLLVEQVHPRLEELLGQKVIMGPVEGKTVAGDEAKRLADGLKDGEVLLLENLRLYAEDGEEANDPRFAERLAALGDIFVYDAYGTAHRSHASTVGITNYLTSVAGLLLTKEIDNLKYTIDPERPNAVIMGGAKISDKIEVINALLEKMDVIMIGGGMANTFLKAYKNTNVQSSLVDDKSLIIARYLIEEAKRRGKEILLPVDVIAASKFTKDEKETVDTKVIDLEKGETLPEGWTILDIGPRTIENYKNKLRGARIVIWNGPVGYAEHPQFRAGTYELAKLLINEQLNTRVIVGGGDS